MQSMKIVCISIYTCINLCLCVRTQGGDAKKDSSMITGRDHDYGGNHDGEN